MPKRFLLTIWVVVITFSSLAAVHADAQRKRTATKKSRSAAAKSSAREQGRMAVVFDETLSLLRIEPSLFANAIHRMRRGRQVKILAVKQADGVTFYRVSSSGNVGWVQADALITKFRPGDEERFVRLIQAAEGFDQIELASLFLKTYQGSRFRPSVLLLLGDLAELAALKISRDAANRLSRREMAASGAPLHSYFLNFVSLDRYRKLGVKFLFDPSTRQFHYDGSAWKEIVERFAVSSEAIEAQKRLTTLREKSFVTPPG